MHRGGLVVGIGAGRGVAVEAVTAALKRLASEHRIYPADIRAYASLDTKAAEAGILAAIAPAPLRTYPAAVLALVPVPNPSGRVAAATGTPSVAEAAALHAAAELARGRPGELVLTKVVFHGVTVAVARVAVG